MTPSHTITAIRALMPAIPEVRRLAASLVRPLDPIVEAYLATHCEGWDWPVDRWFESIDVRGVDAHVDVSLQPGGVIEILDWSAVWLRWRPCRASTLRLLEPPRRPIVETLAAINRYTRGQLACDLRKCGHYGEDLVELFASGGRGWKLTG